MTTRKIDGDEARLAVNGDSWDFDVISTEITGESRWEVHYTTILKDRNEDGKFWQLDYSLGATEYQDSSSFDDGSQTLYQVRPVERVVTVYERVKGGSQLTETEAKQSDSEGNDV